jgi:hypothetical protein
MFGVPPSLQEKIHSFEATSVVGTKIDFWMKNNMS